MTHRSAIIASLGSGPRSDYALYHLVRAQGIKASPSSIRTRRSELVDAGLVQQATGYERTPSGRRAALWALA